MISDATGLIPAMPPEAVRRERVRTPGKHIVLAFVVAALLLSLSTSVLAPPLVTSASRIAARSIETSVALEPFLVDLSPDRAGRKAYLKLTLSFECEDATCALAIQQSEELIKERILFFLRELSQEDFAGSDSMLRLKKEIRRRISLIAPPASAADVRVHELVIQ